MSEDHDPQLPFKLPSPVTRRLVESGLAIDHKKPDRITYQHTVFCQTCLPYRDPGDVKLWERKQGKVILSVEAGRVINPQTEKYVQLGLPCGPKPRLLLMHLNAEALKNQSPEIEVEDSMTAFVERVLGYSPNGYQIRTMKEQLARLSGATIRLATVLSEEEAFQVDIKVVTAFNLWFPKDSRQRVLWPSAVRLSQEYFDSLTRHAVPLDERAVSALSHTGMGLDIYSWLAQRLHRIEPRHPQFITWKAVKDQFGPDHKRMKKFRENFLEAFHQVHSQYRAARVEVDGRGLTLRNSPPPIKGRLGTVKKRGLPKTPEAPAKQAELSLSSPPSASGKVLLRTQTYEDAKKYARGLDVYEAERVWHAWRTTKEMEVPDNPDAAFLGWFKKYAAKHGQR